MSIGVIPDGLAIQGSGSPKLKLTGTLAKIRQALMILEYRSPRGFIGRDFMYGELQSKSLLRQAQTELDVRMSCGDQQVGTLLRFDLGRFDPATDSEWILPDALCLNTTRPNYGGNRRRLLVQPNRINQSFLFTNWAGGKEYSAEDPEEYSCDSQSQDIPVGKCQPSSGMPGEGVAIYGHKDREGTWFSVPAEAQKCDATREHSICG